MIRIIDTPAFGPHRARTATAGIARFLDDTLGGVPTPLAGIQRIDGSLMTTAQIRALMHRVDPKAVLRIGNGSQLLVIK